MFQMMERCRYCTPDMRWVYPLPLFSFFNSFQITDHNKGNDLSSWFFVSLVPPAIQQCVEFIVFLSSVTGTCTSSELHSLGMGIQLYIFMETLTHLSLYTCGMLPSSEPLCDLFCCNLWQPGDVWHWFQVQLRSQIGYGSDTFMFMSVLT